MSHCSNSSCAICQKGHHHQHECPCCCHHHEEAGDLSTDLLDLADAAWMELLKEKIKKHIEKRSGAHLDQLAAYISENNHARWSAKMAEERTQQEFEDKLMSILMSGKKAK